MIIIDFIVYALGLVAAVVLAIVGALAAWLWWHNRGQTSAHDAARRARGEDPDAWRKANW